MLFDVIVSNKSRNWLNEDLNWWWFDKIVRKTTTNASNLSQQGYKVKGLTNFCNICNIFVLSSSSSSLIIIIFITIPKTTTNLILATVIQTVFYLINRECKDQGAKIKHHVAIFVFDVSHEEDLLCLAK